jgi:hypothetical protein
MAPKRLEVTTGTWAQYIGTSEKKFEIQHQSALVTLQELHTKVSQCNTDMFLSVGGGGL